MDNEAAAAHAERRRVVLRMVAALVTILAVATILFCVALWPPPPAGSPDELSYWQLVLAFVGLVVALIAIVLAVIFGFYAVEQARLARRGIILTEQGLHDDRAARRAEREAAAKRMRGALFDELYSNWVAARLHEGTARLRAPLPESASLDLSFRVYDALLVGPIWDLQEDAATFGAVRDAYWAARLLSAHTGNRLPWLLALLAGVFGALFPQRDAPTLQQRALTGVALAIAAAVAPKEGVMQQQRAIKALAPRVRSANLKALIAVHRGNSPLTEAMLESNKRQEIDFGPFAQPSPWPVAWIEGRAARAWRRARLAWAAVRKTG